LSRLLICEPSVALNGPPKLALLAMAAMPPGALA
jgi:hypothetical protein